MKLTVAQERTVNTSKPDRSPSTCCLYSARSICAGYPGKRDAKTVLENLSAEFIGGKIYVLMGRNGCGKSTLLKVLAGELHPNAGSADFKCESGKHSRSIEYLPQDYRQALFPWKTVIENVYPWDNTSGLIENGFNFISFEETKANTLSDFGLLAVGNSFPYKLSGGQQQLLLLARSVVSTARIILLDEPFSALDIVWRSLVSEHLRRDWRGKGKVVICVMHEPEEAAVLADEVVFLSGTPMRIVGKIQREPESEMTLKDFRAAIERVIQEFAHGEHNDA
jgi:NitT/TauT family transport system ATP-binding protein